MGTSIEFARPVGGKTEGYLAMACKVALAHWVD
jgi:hypothetical protein